MNNRDSQKMLFKISFITFIFRKKKFAGLKLVVGVNLHLPPPPTVL